MTTTCLQETASHHRENKSFLAAIEKRILLWMARRLPPAVTSDHLSLVGLLAMIGTGISFASLRLTPWAALGVVVCLAANWFGDSLDGTVARVRGRQRPRYGFYVDHVIDIAGAALLFAGLAVSGIMSPLVSIGLLAAYLLVSAEVYLATHAHGVFRMSSFGFGPTELRIVLALGAIRAAQDPWILLGTERFRLFDVGGLVALIGLGRAFLISSVRNTVALSRLDPMPRSAITHRLPSR
jgi:phosphatidylglycerophosphate synthase